MGFFQMIESAFGLSKKSARILVIGLDNSGKSTIIHHLKPKKVIEIYTTNNLGFTTSTCESLETAADNNGNIIHLQYLFQCTDF